MRWYIVKLNWDSAPAEYLGLDGNCWADSGAECKLLPDNREYVIINGIYFFVVTDFESANEYFSFLRKLNLNPVFISVTEVGVDGRDDCDGYDFGNPEGGYSIITDVVLAPNNAELAEKYLNEHLLFRSVSCLNEFLDFIKDRGDDIEYLDGGYQAVAIKKLK
jgi:hypothetical protein